MNRREIEQAIRDEVAEWPGVEVRFEEGGSHPKAVLSFNGLIMRRAFGANQQHVSFPHKVIADMRQIMKQMEAKRREPEPTKEETERRYVKPNPGRDERSDQVERELASPKPTIAEQLAAHPAASTALVRHESSVAAEREALPPLGEGSHNIDEDRYHADPCPEPSLSASVAKVMIEFSPFHAWAKHPRLNPNWEADKDLLHYRIGRAFHAMLLGKGAPIEVYHYADWKKQAARDDRDDSLRRGCTPLLEEQREKIEAMVRAARYQIRQREELAYAMAGGVPERVYIWREETPAGPVWCRMMVDWSPHAGVYAVDWKTTGTGAGPDGWGQRTMWDIGCDIQDAFYRRGFMKVLGLDLHGLIFAVIESDAPHAMMHHRIDYEAQQEADKDVQWAINAWGSCLHRKRWPGYPLDMAWQTKPGWRAQRSDLRREHRMQDLEMLEEQMKAMAEIQPQLEGGEVTVDNPFGLAPLVGEES